MVGPTAITLWVLGLLVVFAMLSATAGTASETAAETTSETRPASERAPAELETATFSMYCYWTGEATLGRIDGVVASRIGHWSGSEIVQVDYDPTRTNPGELAQALKRQRSFYSVLVSSGDEERSLGAHLDAGEIATTPGKPHFIEPKHSLRTRYPKLSELDLTESQAIALNSWSYFGGPMPDVLTPEQKDELGNR